MFILQRSKHSSWFHADSDLTERAALNQRVGEKRVVDYPLGITEFAEDTVPEPYFIDAEGNKQDAPLWDEILGDDTANTWDPSVAERPKLVDNEPPSSGIAKVRALISSIFD